MKKYDDILASVTDAYGTDEPVLTSDIEALFPDIPRRTLFSQIAALVDSGRLERYESGVYYVPSETLAGRSTLNPVKVIRRKYLGSEEDPCGYWAGATLDNGIGLTEQVPARYEVVTNNTGTAQRTVKVGGFLECVVRRAKVPVDAGNVRAQQVLDVLTRRSPSTLTDGQAEALCAFAAPVPAKELYRMSMAWPQKTTRHVLEGEISGVLT